MVFYRTSSTLKISTAVTLPIANLGESFCFVLGTLPARKGSKGTLLPPPFQKLTIHLSAFWLSIEIGHTEGMSCSGLQTFPLHFQLPTCKYKQSQAAWKEDTLQLTLALLLFRVKGRGLRRQRSGS